MLARYEIIKYQINVFEFKFLRDSRTHSGGWQIQSWISSGVWWHGHIYICQIKETAVDRSLQVTGNSTLTPPRRCSVEMCLYIKRSTMKAQRWENSAVTCNIVETGGQLGIIMTGS